MSEHQSVYVVLYWKPYAANEEALRLPGQSQVRPEEVTLFLTMRNVGVASTTVNGVIELIIFSSKELCLTARK